MLDFDKIWQSDLKEIRENKIRFAGLCICLLLAAVLSLNDDSGGEEIILTETPAQVETVANFDDDTKIIAVKNPATSNADKNIKIVIGANADDLFIGDPFKIPPVEKVQPPEIPAVNISPPVAQIPIINEKFVLRGTVIIGNNKSALVQKIIGGDKKSADENLILGIGDSLNGKKILDIATDSVILENGETLYIDVFTDN